MRRVFIAANWKMNPAPKGFADQGSPYRTAADMDIVVFPAATDLHAVRAAELLCGGQCGRAEAKGPFTGDISITMLKDAGCRYVLCGHSERRQYHGETNEAVIAQVIAALECGLHPVLCVGETADERKAGKTHAVLKKQLSGLPDDDNIIIIAYEPVWAIGKESASAANAQEAHAFIRSLLGKAADGTRILYGGSVNPENALALLNESDIDGLLVGGASLDPAKFKVIVEAGKNAAR